MLLIGNGTLITRYEQDLRIPNGGVLVDGTVIKQVGAFDELIMEHPDAEIIDAHGGIIMPGLVNAHANAFAPLYKWLKGEPDTVTDRYYASSVARGRADRLIGLKAIPALGSLFALDCIKNGVTSVFLSLSAPNAISGSLFALSSAFHEAGIRSCAGYAVSEADGARKISAAIGENKYFAEYCCKNGGTHLASFFAISSPGQLVDDTLSMLSRESGVHSRIHIGAPKSIYDERNALVRFRHGTYERLNNAGLLRKGTVVLAPSVLSEEELAMLKAAGSTVVLAAHSNGIDSLPSPSITSLLSRGIPAALGTDNGMSDMLYAAFREFENDLSHGRSEAAALKAVFGALNTSGRLASDYFHDRIGSIKPGYSADVIVLDRRPFISDDPYLFDRFLVGECRGSDVSTVIASGRVLMHEGRLTTLDEKRVRIEASQVITRIAAKTY